MTSSLAQWTLFDGNTTTSTYILSTANITAEESSTTNIPFAIYSNDQSESDRYTHTKPNDDDIISTIKYLCSCMVIFVVITICIVAVFRRFQHSQKGQKKGEERLRIDKSYAHPFEEVAINVDESQSINLLAVSPQTTTTTTTPTN